MRIVNVDWDTDDSEYICEDKGHFRIIRSSETGNEIDSLPLIVNIPDDIDDDDVSDYLSDSYCWCVNSWYEEV